MLVLHHVLGGRYRVGPLIGRGGMADVHRGDDLVTGEAVALKVLRALPSLDRWSAREVAALSRLDHPAVVRLRAWDLDGEPPYLVLDLVEGEPLSEMIRRGGQPEEWTVNALATVADGLAHAHGCGVVHRDIKPSNILVDGDGTPHLADFGVARLVDATATTGAGFIVGTAAYLAPEQVRGERVGPPADVYALGLVLLECLTGRRAYPGTFNEAAAAHLDHDPVIPSTVTPRLAHIVGAATAAWSAARPSADQLAGALRGSVALVAGPPTERIAAATRTAAMPAPSPPPRRGGRRAVAGVVLAGSIVGVAGGLAVARDRGDGSTPPVVTSVPATSAPCVDARRRPPRRSSPHGAVDATAADGGDDDTHDLGPKKDKGHDKAGGGADPPAGEPGARRQSEMIDRTTISTTTPTTSTSAAVRGWPGRRPASGVPAHPPDPRRRPVRRHPTCTRTWPGGRARSPSRGATPTPHGARGRRRERAGEHGDDRAHSPGGVRPRAARDRRVGGQSGERRRQHVVVVRSATPAGRSVGSAGCASDGVGMRPPRLRQDIRPNSGTIDPRR